MSKKKKRVQPGELEEVAIIRVVRRARTGSPPETRATLTVDGEEVWDTEWQGLGTFVHRYMGLQAEYGRWMVRDLGKPAIL